MLRHLDLAEKPKVKLSTVPEVNYQNDFIQFTTLDARFIMKGIFFCNYRKKGVTLINFEL